MDNSLDPNVFRPVTAPAFKKAITTGQCEVTKVMRNCYASGEHGTANLDGATMSQMLSGQYKRSALYISLGKNDDGFIAVKHVKSGKIRVFNKDTKNTQDVGLGNPKQATWSPWASAQLYVHLGSGALQNPVDGHLR